MFRALTATRAAGLAHANRMHMLLGLLADGHAAPARFLRDRGIVVDEFIESILRLGIAGRDDLAVSSQVLTLAVTGVVNGRGPKALKWVARRSGLSRKLGPVLLAVNDEAVRQAVRSGAPHVGVVHVLAGLVLLHAEMAEGGRSFAPAFVRNNQGGRILGEHGVDVGWYAALPEEVRRGAPELAEFRGGGALQPDDLVATAFTEAGASARARGFTSAGTSDLLRVLLATEESVAATLFAGHGVDVASVRDALDRVG